MHRTLLALAVTVSLFSTGLLEPLGRLLDIFWVTSTNGDAGCVGDPYGGCRPAPEAQPDAGCGMDPYGCPQSS